MATLVLTALGTAVGGPIGGALGSLIGSSIDRAVIGGGRREGPRLKELAVTTSSYGAPIPRYFGTVRAAGSVIWATELVESNEHNGGGKGRPSTTTYSYSASFAVALASRPIRRLGRIWADGNLLRGAAGDLKVGGELRVHLGHGDQMPDPLIASDIGAGCPAFRGTAYCVFEALQLAEFGNRIPALTFEIVADEGEVSLAQLVEPLGAVEAEMALPGLLGFSDEGGPLAGSLATIGELYPLSCDASGERLVLRAADALPEIAPMLPEAAVDASEEGFGGLTGRTWRRQADAERVPGELRYYDVTRDFQPGLQRAEGRARPGRPAAIEFPGALSAEVARSLVKAAAERGNAARDSLAWRVAELDPSLRPGSVVRVPDHAGLWRIEQWEWLERGVELELSRIAPGQARPFAADAGQSLPAADLIATPTLLEAFELPWDGVGNGDEAQCYAAVSSASAGWTGAALYAEQAGELVPLGGSGRQRSVIGRLAEALAGSAAMLFEAGAMVKVQLASADFALASVGPEAVAAGANRALVGDELLQFTEATALGDGRWRLSGLLRGRGGTEAAALAGHAAEARFVLLDARPVRLDAARVGSAASVAAIGLADGAPVISPIGGLGAARPLTPVHPRVDLDAAGAVTLRWARRSRGAWQWSDGVEAPLNEQTEAYLVGVGPVETPPLSWRVGEPLLTFSAAEWVALAILYPGEPLWVRQAGSHALSDPLLLTNLS